MIEWQVGGERVCGRGEPMGSIGSCSTKPRWPAGCRKNGTPKMSPCFALHNIILNFLYQLYQVWTSLFLKLLKGPITELEKLQFGRLMAFVPFFLQPAWLVQERACRRGCSTTDSDLDVLRHGCICPSSQRFHNSKGG